MATNSKTTTDHDTIKKWAEKRNGKPAVVKGTGSNGDGAGLLRIDFPGFAEDNLEHISWNEFFDTFEENKLALLYQEETQNGETSRFNKLVNRNSINNN